VPPGQTERYLLFASNDPHMPILPVRLLITTVPVSPTPSPSPTVSPSPTATPSPSVSPTATASPTTSPTASPEPSPTPYDGRPVGDFDGDGCTALNDFLFLLDHWQQDVDGQPMGLEDFLALLDHWQTGSNC
jgi:hypothetical protein